MGISADEVKKLATMARIALSDDEVETLRGEVDSILAYVHIIQKIPLPEGASASPHLDIQNVMRPDVDSHESGLYTEELLNAAPTRRGQYIQVKKIFE